MNKILVFGSSGTIGSELIKILSSEENQVTTTNRKGVKDSNNIQIDLLDINNVQKFDFSKFDKIIYLAQSRNYKNYERFTDEIIKINTLIPFNIANIVTNLGKDFVYASTGSIYRNQKVPITENSELINDGNLSFYASTKIATESLLSEFENISIIRPFYVYGCASESNLLIPRLFRMILKNEDIIVQGKNGMTFNPMHAFDAANAIKLGMEKKVNVLNIAGNEVITLRDLIGKIGEILGVTPKVNFVEGEDQSTIGDIDKLRSLGFTFKFKLDEGLKSFWDDYRNCL